MLKIFNNYVETSTIHGLSYLSERRKNWQKSNISRQDKDLEFILFLLFRVFWISVIFFSIFLFVSLIYKTTSKFFLDQMVIKLSEKQHSVEDIPFPAVTLCPDVVIPSKFFKSSKEAKQL
jgi:hypothetical protein